MQQVLQTLVQIAKLPPELVKQCKDALASNEKQHVTDCLSRCKSHLTSSGDLVKVKVNNENSTDWFALRGHSELFDFSELEKLEKELSDSRLMSISNNGYKLSDSFPGPDLDTHNMILAAMESAQNHQLVRKAGDEEASIVQSIIELLVPFLGESHLFVQLNSTSIRPNDHSHVFHVEFSEKRFWEQSRVLGEAIWIPGLAELPGFIRSKLENDDQISISDDASAVAIPLFAPADPKSKDTVVEAGLLLLISEHITDRDVILEKGFRLSRFVTSSWQQHLKMNQLVHTDNLTGIRNRGFFDRHFSFEMERAQRQGSSLVLLLGDIDHFKKINDKYGHQIGDRVLKTVARELLQGLRRIDLICRVGGEEFALVLPNTELEPAREVVSRVQKSVSNLRLTDPNVSETIRVMISFGGAVFPEAGEDPAELYRVADKMLYLSKQRGRNRCYFWNPNGEPILTLPDFKRG
ncbi:MAG: GGDEF domain-containing protein [bacterium]|nr:GGDEF domain-containing protein [bacterium]MCP4799156.1 GGDEF domain-containing protein [bacterium]